MFGRMCVVLSFAPPGRGTLLDGYPSQNDATTPAWQVRFPSKVKAPISASRKVERWAEYAVVEDRWLRPITPPPGTVTTEDAEPVQAAPEVEAQ